MSQGDEGEEHEKWVPLSTINSRSDGEKCDREVWLWLSIDEGSEGERLRGALLWE